MHWLPLVLISAVCLAAADALTKKYFSDGDGLDLVALRFIVPGVLMIPLAWWYPMPPAPVEFWGLCAVLVPLELFAMLLYMIAIRDSPLYLTLPYMAFTPVFTVLSGYLVLQETVSGPGFAGILLVVFGAYLLNLNHFNAKGWRGWVAPLRAIVHERGSRLMLIAAAIYSVTTVLGKKAMGYVTPMSFGAFYFVLIGGVMLLFMLVHRPGQLRGLTRRPMAAGVIGVMMAVMVVTHFLSIALVEAAYMIAVKRSSLLFGIIFGAILFRERHLARHFIAGGLMVAGVALIVI